MIKFVECKSLDEMGQKVGNLFIQQVKTKPTSTLLLATGSSPIPVYNAIIDDHLKHKTN
jgi:glucosamine-6-phosphate deaminase